MPTKETIVSFFNDLQNHIIRGLEEIDRKQTFLRDAWNRAGGGGGVSGVIQKGGVFEKGGVNFSEVYGDTPSNILQALKIEENTKFTATGVSIVLHPESPMVPIIHMNVRYFEMSNGIWWFGGGIDLTPIYVEPEDAKSFHVGLQKVCLGFDSSFYEKHKSWADDYFYIPHRKETRGVGGIFFDHMGRTGNLDKSFVFDYVKAVGMAFLEVYRPIVEKNRAMPYGENELFWQRIRRGRYVEFNLVWDKGTKFGLDTDGRTESILMSLPPVAGWEYNFQPKEGTKEHQTLGFLKKGIDWTRDVE